MKPLLDALQHSQRQLVLQCLRQIVWVRVSSLKLFCEKTWRRLDPILRKASSGSNSSLSASSALFLLFLFSLLKYFGSSSLMNCSSNSSLSEERMLLYQDYLLECTLLEKIEKIAFPLLGNVLSALRVDSIHCHQHPLILAPGFILSQQWNKCLGVPPLLCPPPPFHLEPVSQAAPQKIGTQALWLAACRRNRGVLRLWISCRTCSIRRWGK